MGHLLFSQLNNLPRGQEVPGPDGEEVDSFLEGGEVEFQGGALHLLNGDQLAPW